jgi:hypothetical protein
LGIVQHVSARVGWLRLPRHGPPAGLSFCLAIIYLT